MKNYFDELAEKSTRKTVSKVRGKWKGGSRISLNLDVYNDVNGCENEESLIYKIGLKNLEVFITLLICFTPSQVQRIVS